MGVSVFCFSHHQEEFSDVFEDSADLHASKHLTLKVISRLMLNLW